MRADEQLLPPTPLKLPPPGNSEPKALGDLVRLPVIPNFEEECEGDRGCQPGETQYQARPHADALEPEERLAVSRLKRLPKVCVNPVNNDANENQRSHDARCRRGSGWNLRVA